MSNNEKFLSRFKFHFLEKCDKWQGSFPDDDDFYSFSKVENKFSRFREVNALIILEKIIEATNKNNIFGEIRREVLKLDTYSEKFIGDISESYIVDLVRCGVCLSEEEDLYL